MAIFTSVWLKVDLRKMLKWYPSNTTPKLPLLFLIVILMEVKYDAESVVIDCKTGTQESKKVFDQIWIGICKGESLVVFCPLAPVDERA